MGRASVGACLLCLGCHGIGQEEPPIDAVTGCKSGEFAVDGGCEPAGLPPSPCAPGETPTDNGCVPAGVPAERCPAGFTAESGGCYPVLPAAPCAPSEVALLGETSCHALVSCGSGRYGDIPVEPGTHYVDVNHAGSSIGSADEPWTSLQQAIDAAPDGAMIAIAAGSYDAILLANKSLRIWGKCPQEVELVGDTSTAAAIEVSAGADGSEIHNVAVQGLGAGVVVWASHDVLIDGVWIHDTEDAGVFSAPVAGTASLTLARSLIEGARYAGVYGFAIEVDVLATVLRDMRPWVDGLYGNGIAILEPQNAGEPETIARIADTLVERTREVGILVQGATATIERSVVRDTAADGSGQFGRGVTFYDSADGRPSSGALVESTLERNLDVGVVVGGSQARIDAVTLHHTTLGSDTLGGLGIVVHSRSSRASAEITRTLLDANTSVGVFVDVGDAVMEGLWVRSMQPNPSGFGYGVMVQSDRLTGEASHADIRYSVVEGCHEHGVAYTGSDGLIEASVIRDVVPGNRGYAVGLGIQYARFTPATPTWATATVKGTLIERVTTLGLHVVADVRVERSLIRETRADAFGLFGDGVFLRSDAPESSLTLIGTRIEGNARAGLGVYGAAASLDTNAFVCNGFDLHADAIQGHEARLEDLGGNACGCGEPDGACKAVSVGLTPPEPLEPLGN